MAPRSVLLALLAIVSNICVAQLISTGMTVVLNDIPYYIPAGPVATIKLGATQLNAGISAAGLVPLTVVETTSLTFSQSDLEAIIANYTASDDVFQNGFLQAIYIEYTGSVAAGPKTPFATSIASNMTLLGTSIDNPAECLGSTLAPGPYFVSSTGGIFQAYRLYSDFAGAFIQPLIPAANGTYAALPAAIPGIEGPSTIAVPSRLYYTITPEQPLAGIRLGVKDIYDIAGVKTSDGNRAWYNLYPAANVSALPVQRLIDAGAVIVGKMKTSQFANGEEATADWVDFHSPFNPRGDGYQDPSSSSSGPGAGMGSYPWLDLTIGSDTGGSIRGPSQVQGLFGNRPSHGLVALTGVMPLAPQLDTGGFLCRDPTIWATAGKVLYPQLIFYNQYPKTIQTINFPNSGDTDSDALVLSFLSKLESFLSASTTVLNLTTLWEATKPASAPESLTSLLNITYPILISKEQIMLVRDPFYADYAAIHDGRLPFVDPAPLVRWAFGDSFPNSTLTDAINNKTTFMNWWSTYVTKNDSITCSDSLVLYVGSTADQQNYRNQYSGPPGVPYGFSSGRISPFSEVPDMVVPIGQASYFSNITLHAEYLPVTIDFLAAKGCDGMIFQLVEDLRTAGIINATQAGQTIDGGQILF
ncbi:hypothetical protein MMC11_008619 [Xylographa trunciseda]|nr:hypothetical protein [Xylographa trunciseda]